MRAERAVVDANVLLSAALHPGGLETALVGAADCLVKGDRDLLETLRSRTFQY